MNLDLFIKCTRAYSLPMSLMAWLIPFIFGLTHGGNIFYGLLALFGIVFVHLGSNMFDDFIDYKRHKRENNPLQKGKCSLLLNNEITVKNFFLLTMAFFAAAVLIGAFFVYLFKLPIIILMVITGLLCLIYPKSSYFGTGEIIIGVIFSPLAFTGVYYVMTQTYSNELFLLSVPFAIMVVTLLYTHSFLDFNYDLTDKKKTLCVLCDNKENAYKLLTFLIFLAYFIIFAGMELNILPLSYFLTFVSVFMALKLFKTLQDYVDKEPQDEEEFLCVFNKAQNLTIVFTLLTIMSCLVNIWRN